MQSLDATSKVHPTWRRCWPRSGHCAAMRHTARAIFILDGAGRGNRTHTLLPEPDFESGASTSSAIPAFFMNQLLTWETCLPVDVLDPRLTRDLRPTLRPCTARCRLRYAVNVPRSHAQGTVTHESVGDSESPRPARRKVASSATASPRLAPAGSVRSTRRPPPRLTRTWKRPARLRIGMAGRKYTRRAPRASRGQSDAPARPEARPRRLGARSCGSKQSPQLFNGARVRAQRRGRAGRDAGQVRLSAMRRSESCAGPACP